MLDKRRTQIGNNTPCGQMDCVTDLTDWEGAKERRTGVRVG